MADAPTGSRADAERLLREADRRLAAHVRNTPLAVIEWDADQRVTQWNDRAERLFGWAAGEVKGKTFWEWRFVHDSDSPDVRELSERMFAGRAPGGISHNRNYTKAGGVVWCEWHNSVLYDEAGRVTSVLSLVQDVTRHRETAAALELSQARLRAALDGANMLAWDYDLVANRWEAARDLAAFHGLPAGPDYSDPERALDAVHPDDVPAVLAGRRHAIETGGQMRYEFRGRMPASDGGVRWFATRGRAVRDEAGRAVRLVAVTTDITERKRADEQREALDRQLRDVQRWESLGVLAGGVAHDFNNILTVVLGSANLARRGLAGNPTAVAYLDQIEQAARRAAEVCRQMLAYSGRNLSATAPLDVPALVRELAPLLAGRAGGCPLRYDLPPGLPPAL
ncbi:MAG: PAS domain S-box protein, partial [Gemmataceae bacterium]|nr:PAS domain S-box protein [Gemmataceae bacterium]